MNAARAERRPDFNAMDCRSAATTFLALGLHPVAIIPGEKRPIGREWGLGRPDPAALLRLFRQYPKAGVGICLGPEKGPGGRWLIDVEGDGAKADAAMVELLAGEEVETFGWSSARGNHYLFTVDTARMQAIVDALGVNGASGKLTVAELPDLELRAGRPGAQFQSVAPPTRTTTEKGGLTAAGEPRRWNGVPAIAELPEAACLYLERVAAKRAEAAATKPTPAPANGRAPADNIDKRIRAYIAKADPAVSGNRGHDQTLKLAAKIGPGFDLPRDRALAYMREYNARCVPPWSEKDLGRKVDEAYKVEPRRGWLLGPARAAKRRPVEDAAAGGGGGEFQDGERVVIPITTREHEVIDLAVAAIGAEPTVYQRTNVLVTILRDAVNPERVHVSRAAGTPRIVSLPMPRLRELLAKRAEWVRERHSRNGDEIMVPAHPPDWAVAGVAARAQWDGIRPIEGIAESPVLRPDGSILDQPGYDPATGLLYEPNAVFPPMPSKPTLADATNAADELCEVVADFPFTGDADRMVWLAAALTPFARHAIDGPCPLFLFDANVSGAGKTKLCHTVAILATGREMACAEYPDADVEMGKTLLSIALAADPMILFDNIAEGDRIGGKSLDRALTATSIKGRILGRSEMTGDVPMKTVFYATGNNLGLRGDALRRIVPCRLESPEVRPEERRDFKIKDDLLKHVRDRRPKLVAAALTILRAYVLAGRPKADLVPMDYPAWCGLVRNAVHWATGTDPCQTRKTLIQADPETNARESLVRGWKGLCQATGRSGLTATEARTALEKDPASHPELMEVMTSWSRDGGLPSAASIGKQLGKRRGRMTVEGCLDCSPYMGSNQWFIRPPKGGTPGGLGGDGGLDFLPSRENSTDGCSTNIRAKEQNHPHQVHQVHQVRRGSGTYLSTWPRFSFTRACPYN